MTAPPEVWLRGPIDGIHPLLQPAAHALRQVREDIDPIVRDLSIPELWARPGGAASIGFHLIHLPGSLDRLISYSRGLELTDPQRAALAAEQTVDRDRPSLGWLRDRLHAGIDAAIDHLRTLPESALLVPRLVGKKRLPSNTLGLIFHAAEHGSRHAGQIVTLVAVVRGSGAP